MMSSQCIFCRIVANESPSYTVYEDETTRAFLDLYGATDGHTLIVPKRHGATIFDYSPEELKEVWTTVQKVARALEKAYQTSILSIGINHGELAGVHHLHVHVMPRYGGDGGGIMQSLPTKSRREELDVSLKKIKSCI